MAPLKQLMDNPVLDAAYTLHDRKVMAPLKLFDGVEHPMEDQALSMTGRSWPH